MVGDETEPSEPSSGGFLDALSHFDWLKIPGAVRAISILVTGSADAAKAWIDVAKASGEARAQAIRDLSKARSGMMAALAKKATTAAVTDPDLVARSIDRFLNEEASRQANRESIGKKTVDLIAASPPKEGVPPPSDDWLNTFSAFAERATSERLREHWASVLAGEIRKPGSFSLAALQILSVMDAELAASIAQVSTWVMQDDHIPFTRSISPGQNYTTLLGLDALGICRVGNTKLFEPSPEQWSYYVAGHVLAVKFTAPTCYQAALITVPGRQILSLAGPPKKDTSFAQEVVDLLKSQGAQAHILA
jgi:uncharacterized protein DUF2806